MFALLQRCILKETLQNFLLCVVSLLSLILIGRGLQLKDLFLGLDFSMGDIALLFVYMMPLFLLVVLPISCMISVFLTILRMSTDREIIALKAGGVGIFQLLFAPALFSFLCMCLAFGISLYGISWGMSEFRTTVLEIAGSRAKVTVQPGVFNKDFIPGLTLFARKVDPQTGKLQQVVFEDSTRKDGAGITILAPEGEIVTDEQRGELVFFLKNGRIYRADDKQVNILGFEEYEVRLNLSELFKNVDLGEVRPKEMNLNDLRRLQKGGESISRRQMLKAGVEVQKRFSLPVACLILGVFALPLACAFEGARRQMGVGISLLLFLVYYGIFSVGLNAGEGGRLPPQIGMWIGNVLFAVATLVGLFMVNKERTPNLRNIFARLRRLRRTQ